MLAEEDEECGRRVHRKVLSESPLPKPALVAHCTASSLSPIYSAF